MLAFHFFSITTAQELSISGRVTSEEDGMGLPGVSIMVKGGTTGTISDVDGYYQLGGVRVTDTLLFSYIGFLKVEEAVSGRREISVVMRPAAETLEEVIVTALGIKRQKRDIGYSTERIEA